MLDTTTLEWRDRLVLSREIETPGARSQFFSEVRRGEFIALQRGVYMPASEWEQLTADERYRSRIHGATVFAESPLVWSHESAAALWRLPNLYAWPAALHTTVPDAAGGRSSRSLVRHTVGHPLTVESIDGLTTTALARTVVDLARSLDFAQAVVFADAALHRTDHHVHGLPATSLTAIDLRAELALNFAGRGIAKAREVVAFADGRADRPGESISRVNMSLARLSMPRLQAPIIGASGKTWFVDFWWPEYNLIGEFDGKAKYTDPQFLRGRTPAEAVYDEKLREDDLRAASHGMTRWPWETATSMPKLRAQLLAAGLR
jgi:hypothetical protein